jgi:beta-phosphoglucomutase-like phosphatase (HAD superfamily)
MPSLSIAPKESCIIIEDSTNGVQAAKAAGIFCVGYNSVHSESQDLMDIIKELNFNNVQSLDSKLWKN